MQITTVSTGPTHPSANGLGATSTNTTGNPGGVPNQAGGFTLRHAPPTTTTYGVAEATAQVLTRWMDRVAGLCNRPGGPTLDEVQDCLLDMHDDEAVPLKLRDDAVRELDLMRDDADIEYFGGFSRRLENALDLLSGSQYGASIPSQPQPQPQPQPIVTQRAPGMAVPANRSMNLAELSAATGRPAHSLMSDALLDMMEDPAVPENVRAAAAEVFVAALDGADVSQQFFDFVQSEAAAFVHHLPGGAQAGSGVPLSRNFGAMPQPAATTGAAPTFARAAQPVTAPIGMMQPGPLSVAEALRFPPRERPMPQGVNPTVASMVQHILQNPEQSRADYIRQAHEVSLRKPGGSSRKLVEDARGYIGFGLDEVRQKELLMRLRDHVTGGSKENFGRSAPRSTPMKAVAFNPHSFGAMESAARGLLAAEHTLPAQLTWPELRPYVHGDDVRVLDAMFTKPDNRYATAGPVSPAAPDPQGQTAPSVDAPLSDPNAKRQRTTGGFGEMPNFLQIDMPMQPMQPQAMPMPMPMPMPSVPAAVDIPYDSLILPATPAMPDSDVMPVEPSAQTVLTAPVVAQAIVTVQTPTPTPTPVSTAVPMQTQPS